MEGATKNEYDLSSAVTFFLVGLGVGSILALVFTPRQRVALEALNTSRRAA
jgi:hypothetical protein